eukprot:4736735-Prymnesium_polylepis.1
MIREAAALLRGLEAPRVAEVVRDSVVEAQLRSIAIEAEHREPPRAASWLRFHGLWPMAYDAPGGGV